MIFVDSIWIAVDVYRLALWYSLSREDSSIMFHSSIFIIFMEGVLDDSLKIRSRVIEQWHRHADRLIVIKTYRELECRKYFMYCISIDNGFVCRCRLTVVADKRLVCSVKLHYLIISEIRQLVSPLIVEVLNVRRIGMMQPWSHHSTKHLVFRLPKIFQILCTCSQIHTIELLLRKRQVVPHICEYWFDLSWREECIIYGNSCRFIPLHNSLFITPTCWRECNKLF